jgi:hypothetical protein
MKLLIAGDSFALFPSPLVPDYTDLENHKGCVEGVSFGELIAKELSIDVESSGCSGAAIPMCVLKALRYITEAQQSNQPITHCIFHLTQYHRISSNNNPKMDNSLLNYNITSEQYFNYSKLKFFDIGFKSVEYSKIIQENLSLIDFEAGNLATTDTDNLNTYIKSVPIAKILSDNIAYLSLLESCCKLNNIKLMIFSVFVPYKDLYPKDNIFNLYNLSYATLHQPTRTWHNFTNEEVTQHNFSMDNIVNIRNGNHMYPHEHVEVASDILEQHRDFFR